jgi:hypothetical protein
MWRSQSDLLVMAREHNRDLVRQAEAERLSRHLSGTLGARIRNWWKQKRAGNESGISEAAHETPKESLRQAADHNQFKPVCRNMNPVES